MSQAATAARRIAAAATGRAYRRLGPSFFRLHAPSSGCSTMTPAIARSRSRAAAMVGTGLTAQSSESRFWRINRRRPLDGHQSQRSSG